MGTHPIFESDFDCLTDRSSALGNMRAELCHFSGLKIHPGHGMSHCRADGKVIRMLNHKVASLYHAKKNPRKLRWTILYRRKNKKGISQEASVKRRVDVTSRPPRLSEDSATPRSSTRSSRSPRSDKSSEKTPSELLRIRRRPARLTRKPPAQPLSPRAKLPHQSPSR